MKKVITPVGTSLFTNYMKDRDLDQHWANIKDQPADKYGDCLDRINRIKTLLKAGPGEKGSAETKSLLKISEEAGGEIEAFLLASDSVASITAAECLRDWGGLEKCGIKFDRARDVIAGLRVDDKNIFEKQGMPNLIARIEEIADNYYENMVINITGGFKATIPYLTILGQVHSIPIYYIFEDTEALIRIPQAPVDISWGIFEKYADVFRDLEEGIYDWPQYKRKRNIGGEFQECLWTGDGLAELNAVGKIFWNRFKNFFIVKIATGGDYFQLNQGDKSQVNRAITELHKRLTAFIESNNLQDKTASEIHRTLRGLGEGHDLRHGPTLDNQTFVFKSTDVHHTRIVYSLEAINREISLKVYLCRTGSFDHSAYLNELPNQFALMKSLGFEFTSVPMKKP